MKNLIVVGLLSIILTNCAGDEPKKKTVNTKAALTDTNVVVRNDEVVPIVAGPTGIPDSYTFLDTPDANLCVDAFIRKGIALPADTVARTLDAHSWKSEGIAISDIETSITPILNVIHIRSQMSNVMFQFMNRKGYYCIVKNTAEFSNVRIQRSCESALTEIEPITHDSHRSSLNLFWPIFVRHQEPSGDPDATQGAYNSRIEEMPCIP